MNVVKYVASALVLAVLSGCASSPVSSNLRRQAQKTTFQQVRADPEGTRGTVVIWGGRIINIENDTNGGAIYIVCLPIRSNGRPSTDGPSPGRFIASSADFVDPEMFPPETLITVAGQLDGVSTEQLGNIQYTYPVVDIRETHVWLEAQSRPNSRVNWSVSWGPSWYWGPGWGPGWSPGWSPGWGWGPGWYSPGFRGGVHIHGGGGRSRGNMRGGFHGGVRTGRPMR